MPAERSPILAKYAADPHAKESRPRGAWIVSGALALATLAVASLNGSFSLSTPLAPTASLDVVPTFARTVQFPADEFGHHKLLPYCEERYITQRLDQFTSSPAGTFEQRYFVCGRDQFFNKNNGTIFFYNGNEGDVLLYLNNTGLMWENAEEFNAVMVFAEHRYFGKSMPFGGDVLDNMKYLASTQALADYAVLIEQLKQELGVHVPVIAFGGSYGGMLSAWFRFKYPHIVDGAIAASAPLLHTTTDPENPLDSEAFMRTVVFDMTEAAGSSANCAPNTKKAIDALGRLSATAAGRQTIGEVLRLCKPERIDSVAAVQALVDATVGIFGNLAMGNFPYPSSYIMEGLVNLPAYPMRVACEHLASDFADGDDAALLAGLRDAVGVYYNATGREQCLFPPGANSTVEDVDKGNFWGYLACAELYMPLTNNGLNGVFPPQPSNESLDDANCKATWGVHIRPEWAVTQYGGLKALRESASNIVFSNGNYDPFSGTGVLQTLSKTVVAVVIEGGAHHVDLFFSHPMDPPSLTQARELEKQHMHKWVQAFYEQKLQRNTHL